MKKSKNTRKLSFILILFVTFLAGCSIGQQAKEIKTLADCKYTLTGVDDVFISGTDVQKLIENRDFALTNSPSLALGFLSKNIPLRANLHVTIDNPTDNAASINYFDYEILVNNHSFTEGTIDQEIHIQPKEEQQVELAFNANIYEFLKNDSIRNDIQNFILASSRGVEQKASVTLKIKPAIVIKDKLFKYPGFISINRELNSNLLGLK
ncbi:NDR1/HIN1-like protein [Albibacterium indicum]|uniref:NDR1/HIN1-like protein n=1 Tax=Albibacterium indicum TaxID=2292082 RepID=UPI000E4D0E5E|nr:LEA type 2 family protein [Pedobacter indicus]